VVITEPATAVSISSVASVNVLCKGANNGSITVTASGGTGAIQYSKDNGTTYQASNIFSPLAPGSYTIMVKDANGCTASYASNPVVITEPATAVSISSVASVNVLCKGSSTGSITVTASGGTGAIQYSKDNGTTYQASNIFSNIPAGSYTIKVKDANACTASYASNPVVITEPATAISISSVAKVNVLCKGANNGSITVTASGGTGALQYSKDNGTTYQASNIFSPLAPGSYTIMVKDANGCTVSYASNPVVITEPAALVMGSITTDSTTCNGYSDGAIKVSGTNGGTLAYTYILKESGSILSTNGTGNFLNIPGANDYTVVLSDANGCSDSVQNIIVGDPDLINFDNIIADDITCHGGNDGSIEILASGGVSPYTYSKDSGKTFQPQNLFSNLSIGSYYLVIKDKNNCEERRDFYPFVFPIPIDEPNAITPTINLTDVTCFNAKNGSIVVSATGGRGPKSYSIDNWATYNTTGIFNTLSGGNYIISIKDTSLCELDSTIKINEPDSLKITSQTSTDITCASGPTDGKVTIVTTGGNPGLAYTLDSLPANLVSTNGTGLFTGLKVAKYYVTVTDPKGCTPAKSDTFTISEPATLVIKSVDSTNLVCNGDSIGSITIHAKGGATPILFSIHGDVAGKYQTDSLFTGLKAGSYDVYVKDAGCQKIHYGTVKIKQPAAIKTTLAITNVNGCYGDLSGKIVVHSSGGTGAKNFSLDGGAVSTDSIFIGLAAKAGYAIAIKDSLGCELDTTATITQPTKVSIAAILKTKVDGIIKGTATIIASGGTGSLLYWLTDSLPKLNDKFTNLSTGLYMSHVKDGMNCQDSLQFSIIDTAGVSLTATKVNVTCNGGKNGQIHTSVSGGTTPYTLTITKWGVNIPLADTIALDTGTYIVKVVDAHFTSDLSILTISVPAAILPVYTVTNASNGSSTDGSIAVTATGGTGILLADTGSGAGYILLPNTFSSLKAADYLVKVKDGNGCKIDSIITVYNNSLLKIDNSTPVNVACYNDTTGSVTAIVLSGIGPYFYELTGAAYMSYTTSKTSHIFSSLKVGLYRIRITDKFGNIKQTPIFSITQPASALKIDTIIATNQTNIVPNGSLTINATGGYSGTPYNYSISNGTSYIYNQNLFTNLLGDSTYKIAVKDVGGCIVKKNSFLLAKLPLILHIDSTVESCYGNNDGKLKISIVSGNKPYIYSINNLITKTLADTITTKTYSGLTPGIYNIVVIDKFDTVHQNVTIKAAVKLIIDSIKTTHASSGPTGTMSIYAEGGTGAYTYSYVSNSGLIGSSASNVITGLKADTFNVTVTDANSCSTNSTTIIKQDTVLKVTINITDITCLGNPGIIKLGTLNAVLPVIYKISNPTYGYNQIQTDSLFKNIPDSGTYHIVVKDAEGKIFRKDTVVKTIVQPISVVFTENEPACSDTAKGTIFTDVSGGKRPYSFGWVNLKNTLDTLSYTANLINVQAGNYRILVTDTFNCSYQFEDSLTYTPMKILGTKSSMSLCNAGLGTGSIQVNVTGKAPIHYIWSQNSLPDTSIALNLLSGNYSVYVKDADNCIDSATNIQISALDTFTISKWSRTNASCTKAGIFSAKIASGIPGYRFVFDSLGTNTSIYTKDSIIAAHLLPGNYNLQLLDSLGCYMDTSINIGGDTTLTAKFTLLQMPSCQNTNDGILQAKITSGTAPYKLEWFKGDSGTLVKPGDIIENSNINDTLSNVSLGWYSIYITDSANCSNKLLYNVPSKDTVTINNSILSLAKCTISGVDSIYFTGKPGFTYFWINNPANEAINTIYDYHFIDSTLVTGLFTLSVTDSANCHATQIITMNSSDNISFDTAVSPASCDTLGNIELSKIHGSYPIIFNWSNPKYNSTLTDSSIKTISWKLDSGAYQISVTDKNGCINNKYIQIPMPDKLIVNAGPDTIICRDRTTNEGGYIMRGSAKTISSEIDPMFMYTWTPVNDFVYGTSTTLNAIVIDTLPDRYLVNSHTFVLTVNYKGRCHASDTVVIAYHPSNGVSLPSYDTISHGEHIIVPLIGGTGVYNKYYWHWYGNTNIIVGDTSSRTVEINIPENLTGDIGYLFFQGTTVDNCTEWDTTILHVENPVVPFNVFTPNGDGRNDYWYIPHAEFYPDMLVEVFNRWGEKVFSQKGYVNSDAEGWHGVYNRKTLPTGTYYYIITIPSEKPLYGTITIMK
jgi:gliding motility-associated-like protein